MRRFLLTEKSQIPHNLERNDKFNHGFGSCFVRGIEMPCTFFGKGTPRSTQNTHLQTKGGREKDVMIAASLVRVCVCKCCAQDKDLIHQIIYFASKKYDMIVGKEWRMEKWYAC